MTQVSGIAIKPGVAVKPNVVLKPSPVLALHLDASTFTTGDTTWTDTISSKVFTLYNGVTRDNANGGSLVFDQAAAQYAEATSLAVLPKWTVEVWHYFSGFTTGQDPCIVTEIYNSSAINFTLGCIDGNDDGINAAWFNGGGWIASGAAYPLTAGQWYQIVGTYDGSTVKLYVNNTLVGYSTGGGGRAWQSGYGIRLMRRWDNTDYWGGKLAIVKIYDGDIGSTGVANSWNANKARFGLS